MPTHKLQITFAVDDAGRQSLALTHRVVTTVAGVEVSHAEPVELQDEAALAGMLRRLLDTNRAAVEQLALPLAINHAAAVLNKPQKGVKRVKLGGRVGAAGGPELTARPKG